MPRWAQPVCYQLPVQHGEVEEGCSKMMIPQVETTPVACQLSVWMSTSHGLVVLSLSFFASPDSLPQIKEAADIIQKLHLIAQELPFDRWVRHPAGAALEEPCRTRGRWCNSDVDYFSQSKPNGWHNTYQSILSQYHMFLEIKQTFTFWNFTVGYVL